MKDIKKSTDGWPLKAHFWKHGKWNANLLSWGRLLCQWGRDVLPFQAIG